MKQKVSDILWIVASPFLILLAALVDSKHKTRGLRE